MDVRPFAPKDGALLFGLARLDRGADARTLEVLEHETVFVAEVGGVAAGYVALRREGPTACVEQLFVSPEHEGEGVGTRLLEHAEGYAISERAEVLQVVVEPGNERAARFYRGRGFVERESVFELVLPRVEPGRG
ncbi:MAG TPA: GNAT family N-acetyltransferase [Gaiellaceae bacterium]|nr:GNAT family N-acetyltransferase [Gaiellaceae bacterium]